MKKRSAIAGLIALVVMQSAFAEDIYDGDLSSLNPIQDKALNQKDPCTVVMCMAEKLYDSTSKDCEPVVSYFSSIRKFGHHGFDPGKTFNKRRDKLNECPGADPANVSGILGKFGRMRGF